MSEWSDGDIIKFYRTVQGMLGMGQLWLSLDVPTDVTLRWEVDGPAASGGGRVWVEKIPAERILGARDPDYVAFRTAERMREAHRATVTDARRLPKAED